MSVELVQLRNELFRDAVANGWHTPGLVSDAYKNRIPAARLERWYTRLRTTLDPALPGGRLINHFSLGADPEFVLTAANGAVAKAHDLGMKAGLAFGADNNGRLVELRPAPSRSALSVLASTWLTLRWMAVFLPDCANYGWRSGAFAGGDGLGGHVHLGRKQLNRRTNEVASLDRLTHLCFTAGIFNREEGRLRYREARGAPHGEQYGRPSDIRSQPHGYEYRTMPSWMDNPWLAYFILTTSKLVVAMPDLFKPLTQEDGALTNERARGWLRLLLGYFAPLDDDARLAHAILNARGFPQHNSGMDFKNNWGVFAGGLLGSAQDIKPPTVIPTQIPSTVEAEQQLMEALLAGAVPELGELAPNWLPHTLPAGYQMAIDRVTTQLAPNLGELTAPLATHVDNRIEFGYISRDREGTAFQLSNRLAADQRAELTEKLHPLHIDFPLEGWALYVSASKNIPLSQLETGMEHILDSGAYPLWRIKDVQANSYESWKNRKPEPKKFPTKGRGLILRSN